HPPTRHVVLPNRDARNTPRSPPRRGRGQQDQTPLFQLSHVRVSRRRATTVHLSMFRVSSERLLVTAIRRGLTVPLRCLTARRFAALVLRHRRRSPTQGWTDLVSHNLDLRAFVAALGFPRPLIQTANDDHAVTFLARLRDVLAKRPPRNHIEERDLFLPLICL